MIVASLDLNHLTMSSPVIIDGVKITSPAEYLRFLSLSDERDEEVPTSRRLYGSRPSDDNLQEMIEGPELMKTDGTTRLFALLIGINEYERRDFTILRGAVADAHDVKSYIEDDLKVPSSHIQMLIDKDATRQKIIDALIALKDDKRIQKGDAILIYYAGHGAEVSAPSLWRTKNSENMVNGILPYDFNPERGIHIILEGVLTWLIENIVENRGDNVTVILDCCYGMKDPHQMARTALMDDYAIPDDLDNILGYKLVMNSDNHSIAPPTAFNNSSDSSYMLLVACAQAELAMEAAKRGQFTKALVGALRKVSPDQVTYAQLFDRLDSIVGQNPQLKGKNRNHAIFNSKAAKPAHYYKVHTQRPYYILHAGSANGVCPGAQFTVYPDYSTIFKTAIGVLEAKKIEPFRTLMCPVGNFDPESQFTDEAYAVQTRAGEQEMLRVYIAVKDDLKSAFDAHLLGLSDNGGDSHKISLVQDRSTAHLELQRIGDEIRFIILDDRVRTHGLTECIPKIPAEAEEIRRALQGAAQYYYHLNRSYRNSMIESSVVFELVKLEFTGVIDPVTGRILRRSSGEDLWRDGHVLLNIRDNDPDVYGIQITNSSDQDLYPNIFYFDNSELSITCFYMSGASARFKVDCPLKRGSVLTLGFGNGGSKAFQYRIPDGQDVDVGFLKCFFSTSPVDLSNIDQESRGISPKIKRLKDVWGAVLIPVVQRRVKP